MEIIYLLIPLSIVLLCMAIWGFFWAVRNGQFDDLDAPALMILDDDALDDCGVDAAPETVDDPDVGDSV